MNLHCDLCGEPVLDREWILLNRYGVGFQTGRCMTEAVNDDDEYHWHLAEDDGEDDVVTGRVLHWPVCAVTWIDGKMAEGRVLFRQASG